MLKEKFERVKEFVKDHKEEIRDIAVYATISGVSMLIGYRINGSRSRKVIADKERTLDMYRDVIRIADKTIGAVRDTARICHTCLQQKQNKDKQCETKKD